jgi:hypothetical protein
MLRRVLSSGEVVTTLRGVQFCGIAPKFGVERCGMQIRQRPDGSRSTVLVDVQRCRSQCCPDCLPAMADEDTRELILAGRHAIHSGGSLLHLTTTARHRREELLVDTIERVQVGWRAVVASGLWKDLGTYGVAAALELARLREDRGYRKPDRDALVRQVKAQALAAGRGLWAWASAREATHGRSAGWHPHQHSLLILRGEVTETEAAELQGRVLQVYRAGLAKVDASCDDEHGVRIEVATTRRDAESIMGKYLNKIAAEVTRGDRKRPKTVKRWRQMGDGRRMAEEERHSPWDFLRIVAADPDLMTSQARYALRLWREFEQATRGKARVTHGGDWAELLAEAEACENAECAIAARRQEEESLPAEIPGEGAPTDDTPDTVDWDRADHGRVMTHWVELGAVGDRDGWAGVLPMLDALGVRWRWRTGEDENDVGPVLRRNSCSRLTEAHRRGECGCWVRREQRPSRPAPGR